MKIINFKHQGHVRVGALDGDTVVDFSALQQAAPFLQPQHLPALGNTIELIRAWDQLRPLLTAAIAFQSRRPKCSNCDSSPKKIFSITERFGISDCS